MRKPVRLTKQDVVDALRNVLDLDDTGMHDRFDLFLARPIEDPYLESIRAECLKICQNEVRPEGRDISDSTAEWVKEKLHELQGGI